MTTTKISTTLTLPIELVEKCKAHYNTANASDAIYKALADFLLLPYAEQRLSSFALHNVIPNIEDRRNVRSFSIRVPKKLSQIIGALSERNFSETVSMILGKTLYSASHSTCAPVSAPQLLYVIGNKWKSEMQAAIDNIKGTAERNTWTTSVETCAGGLGIYSNFKFADNEILNDSDWQKINLYKAVQENPRELIIQARSLTVDQITFDRLKELVKNTQPTSAVNYEIAAAYLFLNFNSYRKTGITMDNKASETCFFKALSSIGALHQRLKQCAISDKPDTALYNLDIFRIIEKYRKQTDVLFIIDPPYLDADLYNSKENEFGQKEHECLAKLLRMVKQNNKNDFIYFCRITAPHKYQNKENSEEYNIDMKGCIDDLYYGQGFYYIDVPYDKDGTIERIITSFDFDGAVPYGKCEGTEVTPFRKTDAASYVLSVAEEVE